MIISSYYNNSKDNLERKILQLAKKVYDFEMSKVQAQIDSLLSETNTSIDMTNSSIEIFKLKLEQENIKKRYASTVFSLRRDIEDLSIDNNPYNYMQNN